MKKYIITTVLFLLITLLSACEAMTYEEVFRKSHPNAVILHEIKVQDGFVILYNENQNIGAIQLSLDGDRWSIVSLNTLGDAKGMSYNLINKGENDEVLYGRIYDSEIAKVQLRTEQGKDIEAVILEPERNIWYLQWKYDNAELTGLSNDGTILYRSTLHK